MLDLKKVTFTDKQLLNEGVFLLVDMSPALDGATNDRIGTDIVVALTGQRYEQITVRVPDLVTCSAFDSVAVRRVEFTGFAGHFDLNDEQDKWRFIAKADQFKLVEDAK